MQSETAFWVLSSTAQAAAALAGLSVVVMVFQLRLLPGLRPDVRQEDEWPLMETVIIEGWAKAIHIVASSASLFLAAAIGSLATLGLLAPSDVQVPGPVLLLLVAMLVLIFVGGALMAYFVWFLARNLAPIPIDKRKDYIEIESTDEGGN